MKTIDEINKSINFLVANGHGFSKNMKKCIADEIETLIVRIKAREPGLTHISRSHIENEVLVTKLCEAIKANSNITGVSLRSSCLNTASLELLRDNNSIESLCLMGCNLDDHAAKILSSSKNIEHLYLQANNFTSEGAAHFVKFISKLQTLDLSYCNLSNSSADIFSTSKTITKLILRNNEFSSEDINKLAKSNAILQYLDLSNNVIGNEGANAFFEDNKTIKYLYLSGNKINAEGTASIPKNKSLYSLDLSNNDIGDEGAKNIALNDKIVILSLSRCGISDKGAAALGEGTHAASLDLDQNNITNKGAIVIAQNKYIMDLNLNKNYLGSDAANTFSRNIWITHLGLYSNYIGGYNGVKALASNSYLTRCLIGNNHYASLSPLPINLPSFLPDSFPGLDSVRWTAVWIFKHSGCYTTPFEHIYLYPKIEENKENTKELVARCRSRNAERVKIWIKEKHTRPYGHYFDSLLKTKGTVLHFAVMERDIKLLTVLLDHVPASLLYIRDDVIDGLTYEELADKMQLPIEESLRAKYRNKCKTDTYASELQQYSNQLKDLLIIGHTAAASIAGGCLPSLNIAQAGVSALVSLAQPALGDLIKMIFQTWKKHDARTVITWLKDQEETKKLATLLIGVQSKNDTDLIDEEVETEFDNLLCILKEEKLQWKEISSAKKRATVHVNKLLNFMKIKSANDNITPEEWRDTLLKAVMGNHYRYSRSAPTTTRAELEAQLKEKEQMLDDKTAKLSAAEAALEINKEEIKIENEKVIQLESELSLKDAALVEHQNTISSLQKELDDALLKLQNLETTNSNSKSEIIASATRIKNLVEILAAYKNIPPNVVSSWQPNVNALLATRAMVLIGRDHRNRANNSTILTQAANSTSQTGASINAKI